MSARTAVETIQAAIDRLEALKPDYFEMNGWLAETVDGASGAIDDPGYAPLTNDPIIVTLHRTIDAQLHILQETVFQLSGAPEARGFIGNEFNLIMQLARAILGDES